jgi:hypothetical protein
MIIIGALYRCSLQKVRERLERVNRLEHDHVHRCDKLAFQKFRKGICPFKTSIPADISPLASSRRGVVSTLITVTNVVEYLPTNVGQLLSTFPSIEAQDHVGARHSCGLGNLEELDPKGLDLSRFFWTPRQAVNKLHFPLTC